MAERRSPLTVLNLQEVQVGLDITMAVTVVKHTTVAGLAVAVVVLRVLTTVQEVLLLALAAAVVVVVVQHTTLPGPAAAVVVVRMVPLIAALTKMV